jgi:hypothetical protein
MSENFITRTKLAQNPFEHYAAETEPNISEYAVKPPYLVTISERAKGLNSFVLFGDRGAGKSATRITVFNDLWAMDNSGKKPFSVNLTEFTSVAALAPKGTLTDLVMVKLTAFFVVEQMLIWLSSLTPEDREIYVEGLEADERSLVFALYSAFYTSLPELDREVSNSEALKLLNAAWTTQSGLWINKRWDAISKISAGILAAISKSKISKDVDISDDAEKMLLSLRGDGPKTTRAILSKLVDFARAFGFSGVCVLVDKVDETPTTSNSAETSAKLVHPILDHIQLLEVEGFSWVFFLWGNLQAYFNKSLPVRLDKISHANITWEQAGLLEMIEKRVRFFSQDLIGVSDLFASDVSFDDAFTEIANISVKSPRETIRVFDTIIREHDAKSKPGLLDTESLTVGIDKYVSETIETWFNDKYLQQVLRLGLTSFVNRDVQGKFKIGDQGARVKIKSWEDAGLVRQDGTQPSELGGKPVYRYSVADPRIARIIDNKLHDIVGAEIDVVE